MTTNPTIDNRVQAVFDKAMYLIDAQNENTGETRTAETREYEVRTPAILNTLLDLVYPASDTFAPGEDGRRPALPDVTGLEDTLDLDPRILRDVLPHGLAAKLLCEENPELASYFQQCFEQSLADARSRRPTVFVGVEESLPYGGIEFGRFGHW